MSTKKPASKTEAPKQKKDTAKVAAEAAAKQVADTQKLADTAAQIAAEAIQALEAAGEDADKDALQEALDKAQAEAKQALEDADQAKPPAAQKMVEPYVRAYPDNKVFYVTSDKQVFLEGSKNEAIMHQANLKEGELQIVKI